VTFATHETEKNMSDLPLQVTATQSAIELIDRLRVQHGPVLFHQSGGCCDGSSPMCYPQNGNKPSASKCRVRATPLLISPAMVDDVGDVIDDVADVTT
jgi:uncharacterized protein (DUF779 family)